GRFHSGRQLDAMDPAPAAVRREDVDPAVVGQYDSGRDDRNAVDADYGAGAEVDVADVTVVPDRGIAARGCDGDCRRRVREAYRVHGPELRVHDVEARRIRGDGNEEVRRTTVLGVDHAVVQFVEAGSPSSGGLDACGEDDQVVARIRGDRDRRFGLGAGERIL